MIGLLVAGLLGISGPSPDLQAGQSFTWSFPELAPTLRTLVNGMPEVPKLTVYLPRDYTPERKYPLIVLIPGAEGSAGDNADFARQTVGDEGYICVGVPSFKKSIVPMDADEKNKWSRMYIGPGDGPTAWSRYRVMFDRLFAEIRNIDAKQTFFGGFSNGANTVAAILSAEKDANPFLARFHHFVIVEGGRTIPPSRALRDHRFFLVRGGENKTDYHLGLKAVLTATKATYDEYIMPGVGHDYPPPAQVEVRNWIRREVAMPGESVISGRTEDSAITITTTTRCAGAIHSLTWRGQEFLDSADHGRQLQSASNFDAGSPIQAETYNPTEAGSARDGAGNLSSSQLLSLIVDGNRLMTFSRMAFWLNPGETSGGNPAKNRTVTSNHVLIKDVKIGVNGRSHLIRYDVIFMMPKDERHHEAVFESLTGYMPEVFKQFWRFDPKSRKLEPLSDGPGEQPDPVVLATADGAFAMGIYSPEKQPKGYGRWRFGPERVVKWNCVFRETDPVPGAGYHYRHYVAVGTLNQVREELDRLSR